MLLLKAKQYNKSEAVLQQQPLAMAKPERVIMGVLYAYMAVQANTGHSEQGVAECGISVSVMLNGYASSKGNVNSVRWLKPPPHIQGSQHNLQGNQQLTQQP